MEKMTADETRDRLQFHRAYWLHVLTGCLGWSVKAANEWADEMLEGPPVVLHDKPNHWIAGFFLPASAFKLPPDKLNELRYQIEDAIDDRDTYYDEALPDCATITARVRQVLDRFQLREV